MAWTSGISGWMDNILGTGQKVEGTGSSDTSSTGKSSTAATAAQQSGQQTSQDTLTQLLSALTGSTSGISATRGTGTQEGEQAQQQAEFQKLFSGEDVAGLRELLGTLIQNAHADSIRFSKEAAIRDTQGAVSSMSRQLNEQIIPGLLGNEAAAGAYNASATKQLANDAVARTSEAAGRLQLQTISDYHSQELASLAPVLNAFQMLRGADATSGSSSSNKNSQKTTSAQEGSTSEQTAQNTASTQTGKTTGTTSQNTTSQQQSDTSQETQQSTDQVSHQLNETEGHSNQLFGDWGAGIAW